MGYYFELEPICVFHKNQIDFNLLELIVIHIAYIKLANPSRNIYQYLISKGEIFLNADLNACEKLVFI